MNPQGNVSITVYRQFEAFAQAHAETIGTDTHQELFYTPEWFQTLLRHGNTFQGQLQIIVARNEQTNATLSLPTIDEKNTLRGLSNYYASLFGPIGNQASASLEMCNAIARWIRAQPQRWPVIDFSPLDTDQPFFANMQQALKNQGYRTDSYFCFGNWYHHTAEQSFEHYLASRPSELRNTIRRNFRKAENTGPTEITIHHHPGEALEIAIQHFHEIYRNSWKPAESHPEFITELCRIAAQRGWLRLGILTHRELPIAAQLWLAHAGKANIFKLAYAEGRNPFSAGTLLTAELVRHVIDVDGVREIDYLTGDEDYKSTWMSRRRERRGLTAFNVQTLRGICSFSKHQVGKMIWRKPHGQRDSNASNINLGTKQ